MRNLRVCPWRAFPLPGRLLSVVIVASACASAQPAPPSPARVAELEARVAGGARDVDDRLELAAAYLQSSREADALALLEPLRAADPSSAPIAFYLGLAYEQAGRFADARREYARSLEGGLSDALADKVRARFALLGRRELEQAVRAALAQEQSLAAAPAPRTVGVFPFLTVVGDELQPLGRALAELISSDLGQTDRLTILERARVQLFLDEIRLTGTGVVDEQTAARAGRVLGAGRIVQGRVEGTEAALRVQAVVVPVGVPRDPQAAPIQQQGAVANLFDMQTALVLELYRALGIELTVAERERVSRRPTQNVQALLAFGSGLESEDAQRYAQAVERYNRALGLDPGFEEAREARDRAQAALDAQEETPEELAELELAFGLPQWIRRRQRFAGVDEMVPIPDVRDPVSEVLGIEGLQRRGLVDLIIRRPGGTQ